MWESYILTFHDLSKGEHREDGGMIVACNSTIIYVSEDDKKLNDIIPGNKLIYFIFPDTAFN